MHQRRETHPGVVAAEKGDTLIALIELEKLKEHTPLTRSYFAYVIAKERGDFNRALALCREAMQADPQNNVHLLNLGRVFLAAGRRDQAIRTFRKGLKLGRNPRIQRHLDQLGMRRPEVFSFLSRDNLLNKYCGMLLSRIGLR